MRTMIKWLQLLWIQYWACKFWYKTINCTVLQPVPYFPSTHLRSSDRWRLLLCSCSQYIQSPCHKGALSICYWNIFCMRERGWGKEGGGVTREMLSGFVPVLPYEMPPVFFFFFLNGATEEKTLAWCVSVYMLVCVSGAILLIQHVYSCSQTDHLIRL